MWKALAALALLACAPSPLYAEPVAPDVAVRADADIRAVIAAMQEAWNRGDFAGYMAGFLNPGVVFVSRGRFQDGWQGTLDHYVRDYGGDPTRRGRLTFSDIQVEMLAEDAAMLISRYRLERPQSPQYGINTRLMRRVGGRWVISLNHVSSQDAPDTAATYE
ncbi:MAG: nuclear transport factor 2 family protein [Sphingomonadaceae bacterium]|nr:nuclear transport factor 2 family protein [Sphingomonadaceae bacterium]